MSLPAQNVAPQLVAAAGQLTFPFAWRCDDSTLVQVWVNDTLDGGFNVVLNADQTAAPGGTITRMTPCALGDVVTVERSSPQTQTTSLTRYGPFPADTITTALDKMVMLLQELAAKALRALTFKRSHIPLLVSTEMPGPVAGAVLAWVAAGAQFQLSSVPVAAQLPHLPAVLGEALVDSGDHTHFSSAFAPTAAALYRNGQRIFSPGDYSVAGTTWTLVVPVDPTLNEVLNADYTHA
jgi:hypothetical protein